jgi:two-component system response regulator AtoC
MPKLLIVDDEASIHHAFQRAFREKNIEILSAKTSAEAETVVIARRPDAIVLDLHLPDAGGLETFHKLRAIDHRTPIILITGHGTTDLAIEAIKLGAFEYLLKPLELAQIRELVQSAIHSSQLMRMPAVLPEESTSLENGDQLIGQCPAMQELYKGIGRVAAQDVTALLLGESGTGKELVARAIYQHSHRADQPFLAINCAAIPEQLLESELFGHEKGAFTGADRKRIGKFEQCQGGTIFLDEVAELSPLTQAKILRLIQGQQFERVGGGETIQTDVRLIAATNADIEAMTETGRFRRDLFFRLNVYSLRLPPLRERGDDVKLLISHFIQRFGIELNKSVREVSADALLALQKYSWPGNIRELQSVLKQSLLQMQGAVLDVSHLPAQVRASLEDSGATQNFPQQGDLALDLFIQKAIESGAENLYEMTLEQMERELLIRVLRHTNGNQLQAAKVLGIARGSLRTKIRSLGIGIERNVRSEDDQTG